MTTLNEIIYSIDEHITLAEKANSTALPTKPMFRVQEKMYKYVLIHAQSAKLAIAIDGLAEIGPMPPITPLPNLPLWIHGIVNQRGEIVSVIDLNLLFHKGETVETYGKKLAVLRKGSMKIGICLDQVIATVSRPESDYIQSLPSPFNLAAPDVFGKSLQVDNVTFQILQTDAFFGMQQLTHYYISK